MIALVVAILLLLPVWANATTYYVAAPDSPGGAGSNSNNGTSETTPYRTVANCVSVMQPGDTCYVRGGTYIETLILFQRSGTQAAPIKLLNYPNESPIIDFNNVTTQTYRILFQLSSGYYNPIGWITLEGFEIRNGYDGIKFHNLHDSVIRRNWIHGNRNQGVLGNGTRVVFDRNIINHNGRFATAPSSNLEHGLYMHGSNLIVRNNLIYDNLGYGITLNGAGSSNYDPTKHAGPEFAESNNWIIESNIFAYGRNRAGITIWGSNADNARIENNIFYENAVTLSAGNPQGVEFYNSLPSGVTIRNNHFYASGSGGQAAITSASSSTSLAVEGVHYTQSGNVVNVSAPAFVNGGSNSLPGSPDFRLTASAPVNIARTNEFPNNSTGVVGPYKTVASPACSVTANKITCIFPMNTAVPIQNLSTTGVTIGCTGANCPGGGLTASAVSRVVDTDTHVQITVAGFTGNACVAADQAVTLSYNSSTGSWTTNSNIGPYPEIHQKIFSFTNLAVTNQCDGTPPPTEPGGLIIHYLFDEGTGTTATNSGSLGASGNGILQNGVTWATGGGVTLTAQSTQHIEVPYGNGINPTTQDLTIAFEVEIPAGSESLTRQYFGSALGTNQRFYISTLNGTWRLGAQASNDATASDLSVSAGRNHLCLTVNATTDTLTLHKNGVASTSAGARKTVTSYTLSGDFDLGRIADQTSGGGTFRHFVVYQSIEDCNAIYEAAQTPPPPVTGTLAQAAIQFQAVYLPEVGGSPTNLGALNAAKDVVANGAVAVVFQIHCENVADCDATAFKLTYKRNGLGTRIPVPNMETADGIWFWGAPDQILNSGITTTRLTGSCTVTNGSTQLTADQVPSVDLPQDGCVMLRYLVRVKTEGDYFDLALQTENGVDLTGGYDAEARINVIGAQASGAH